MSIASTSTFWLPKLACSSPRAGAANPHVGHPANEKYKTVDLPRFAASENVELSNFPSTVLTTGTEKSVPFTEELEEATLPSDTLFAEGSEPHAIATIPSAATSRNNIDGLLISLAPRLDEFYL